MSFKEDGKLKQKWIDKKIELTKKSIKTMRIAEERRTRQRAKNNLIYSILLLFCFVS